MPQLQDRKARQGCKKLPEAAPRLLVPGGEREKPRVCNLAASSPGCSFTSAKRVPSQQIPQARQRSSAGEPFECWVSLTILRLYIMRQRLTGQALKAGLGRAELYPSWRYKP